MILFDNLKQKPMKTKNRVVKAILLTALSIALVNCAKNVDEPTPLNWNYSTFTDSRDSKTYKYIKIGNQEWMAENLAFITAKGSWIYYGDETYGAKYGRLYSWEAAKQAVPAGWHLPTDAEWKQLEIVLGMSPIDAEGINSRGTNEGGKLKATTGWAANGNGTDEIGFFSLPGGFRSNSGSFVQSEWFGYWWSATESDSVTAWFRYLDCNSLAIFRNTSFKGEGYSVRCVKDN